MAIERIDEELCNGCGTCVKICPMDVFRLDNEKKKAVIAYGEDCMLCGSCVIDCTEEAVTLTPYKTSPLTVSWG